LLSIRHATGDNLASPAGSRLVSTYLFAWNPALWGWPELPERIRRLRRRGYLDIEWASGRTRAIEPGSRAFVVRLGVAPKGLIGAGVTLTAPKQGEHWIEEKAARGIPALYLKLRLETLSETPVVTFEDLARPPYSRFRWGVRSSGTRLPSSLADQLELLWERRLAGASAAGRKARVDRAD
jgi:5-methylcytosine-specific restriction enzyme A